MLLQGPVLANTTLNTYLNILDLAQRRRAGDGAAEDMDVEEAADEPKLFGPRKVAAAKAAPASRKLSL